MTACALQGQGESRQESRVWPGVRLLPAAQALHAAQRLPVGEPHTDRSPEGGGSPQSHHMLRFKDIFQLGMTL